MNSISQIILEKNLRLNLELLCAGFNVSICYYLKFFVMLKKKVYDEVRGLKFVPVNIIDKFRVLSENTGVQGFCRFYIPD